MSDLSLEVQLKAAQSLLKKAIEDKEYNASLNEDLRKLNDELLSCLKNYHKYNRIRNDLDYELWYPAEIAIARAEGNLELVKEIEDLDKEDSLVKSKKGE